MNTPSPLLETINKLAASSSVLLPDIPLFVIDKSLLRKVVQTVIEMERDTYLSAIIAQELDDNVDLLYFFTGPDDFALRISLSPENPQIDSLTGLLSSASFYEREAGEMLGIEFTGLDDPRNLLLPEGLDEHPLRKGYQKKESLP